MPGVIPATYAPLPPPLDASLAARGFERLGEASAPLAAIAREGEQARNLLSSVFGASPYLARVIHTEADFAARCFRENPDSLFAALLDDARAAAGAGDEETIMSALRITKRRAALLLALADLAGFWPLEDITLRLTQLADASVQAAIAFLLRQGREQGKLTSNDPERCGYFALAMGKQGAFELNYSSDIDLIILFDEERAPLAEGVEAGVFFVRMTRQLVKILSEITGEGYVFRADLRLRPDPGSTRAAISTGAALTYYQTMGQNWERAAMIKARPAAGDIAAGEAFLAQLAPWIWRKALDFAAIADVASLKRQIHAVKGHGNIAVAGHNIKLGRGGIREIEFFVQTQQLIAGGRNPALRGRSTLKMLDVLAQEDWISRQAADELKSAYRFLRTLEHRLQMLDDQQTHTLPEDDEGLERLARFAGFSSRAALARALRERLETVQGHYNALFEDAPRLGGEAGALVFTGGEDDPETLRTLREMGFARPGEVSEMVRGWHYGRYAATRAASARERLTEIIPALLAAIARAGEPDATLAAFDRFLERLPSGLQLFSLLRANPHLLDLLVMLLGTAPLLARQLSRRPRLFDAVLDADFFAPLPDRSGYEALARAAIPGGLPVEEALDAARIFASEQKFRIGVRLISETIGPQEASAAYTALAETMIARMLDLALGQVRAAHGAFPGARLAVIAMGKLGGAEMTATSDLDLILVHDFDESAEQAGGRRPVGAGQYFSRLAQRFITALSAPTAEGVLYEVDMRLRPSGSQGPVATHIESFRRYHEESAWTWEHLALTRARVIAGDADLRGEIEAVIKDSLTRPRDEAALRADVLDMRRRILAAKPPASVWDVKLARGGLVDAEFVTQTLQLQHAHEAPAILRQNTQTALHALTGAGFLSEADMQRLASAHALFHHVSHILRLCVAEGFAGDGAPEGLQRLLANAAAAPDLPSAAARLKEAQMETAALFEKTIGEV